MDIARPVQSSPLQVECPHCGQADDDDFESLDDDVLYDMRCSRCSHVFCIAVMDCRACGAECLFCWMQRPTIDRFKQLNCETCDLPYRDHETLTASTQQRA